MPHGFVFDIYNLEATFTPVNSRGRDALSVRDGWANGEDAIMFDRMPLVNDPTWGASGSPVFTKSNQKGSMVTFKFQANSAEQQYLSRGAFFFKEATEKEELDKYIYDIRVLDTNTGRDILLEHSVLKDFLPNHSYSQDGVSVLDFPFIYAKMTVVDEGTIEAPEEDEAPDLSDPFVN